MNVFLSFTECGHDRRPGRLVFKIGPVSDAPAGVPKTPASRRFPLLGERDMALTLTTVQKCDLTITPVDRLGHPARVDGVPEWLTDNTDVLSLVPSADGLTCVITAVGIPGTAAVQVTCDADLGNGVSALVGTLDVEVTAAPATSVAVVPGVPTDQ